MLFDIVIDLSGALSVTGLAIAIQMSLSATGWAPAAVGVSIVLVQVLVLVAVALARALPRTGAVLVAAGVLLAVAELVTPLGRSLPLPSGSLSRWWVVWQLLRCGAIPLFLVLLGGALTRARAPKRPPLRNAVAVAAIVLVALFFGMGTIVGMAWLKTVWEAGAFLVAAGLVATGVRTVRAANAARSEEPPAEIAAAPTLSKLAIMDVAFLALAPSGLLLGAIAYATRLLPAAPVVWGVPLLLYLAGRVLAASPSARRLLHRPAFLLLPLTTIAVVATLMVQPDWPLWALLLPQLLNLLVASVVCHDVIAERREASGEPGRISLAVAAGAAAGGVLAVFVAPLVFATFAEYPWAVAFAALARRAPADDEHSDVSLGLDLGIPAAMGLVLLAVSRGLNRWAIVYSSGDVDVVRILVFALGALLALSVRRWPVRFGVAIAAVLLVASLPLGEQPGTLLADRSVFAADRVTADPVAGDHTLLSDDVTLGLQNTGKDSLQLLGYEDPSGAAGQIFAIHAAQDATHIAILGVRTGSLACDGSSSQTWTFYERDPAIAHAAEDPSLFTFLHDCPPSSSVRIGNERAQLSTTPDHGDGLIVIRGGDGPQPDPSLYTREAMELYASKLAPGGVVAFDITLGPVELQQPIADAAATIGWSCWARDDLEPSVQRLLAGVFPSQWIACARGPGDLGDVAGDPRWHVPVGNASDAWTDDRIPLSAALRIGNPPD